MKYVGFLTHILWLVALWLVKKKQQNTNKLQIVEGQKAYRTSIFSLNWQVV